MKKICIIGAGIAGITLAKELSNQSNLEIILIESGKSKGAKSTLNKEFKVKSKSKSKSNKFSLYEKEIIIIDDCSTDNSREIITTLAKDNSIIKYIFFEKKKIKIKKLIIKLIFLFIKSK